MMGDSEMDVSLGATGIPVAPTIEKNDADLAGGEELLEDNDALMDFTAEKEWNKRGFQDDVVARFIRRFQAGIYGILHVMAKDTVNPAWWDMLFLCIDFFQLMAFPFSERADFPWNKKYLAWWIAITDAFDLTRYLRFSWVSTSIYVICFLCVTIIIGLAVYAGYQVSSPGSKSVSILILRVLRVAAPLFVTSFFIPVLKVFTEILTCPFFDSCDSGWGLFLIMVTALLMVSFIAFAFLISATFYNSDIITTGIKARPHSRVDMVYLAFRTIITITFGLLGAGDQYHSLLLVVTLGGGCVCTYAFYMYMPYYTFWFSILRTCLMGFFTWAAFCLCMTLFYVDESCDGAPGLLFLMGSPILMYVIVVAMRSRHAEIMIRPYQELNNVYEIEMKVRFWVVEALRDLLANVGRMDFETRLADEAFQETLLSAAEVFEWAFQKPVFASSSILYLFGFEFYWEFLKDNTKCALFLTKAKHLNPAFDESFIIYRFESQARSVGASGNKNSDVITIMAKKKHTENAFIGLLRTIKAESDFWAHLSNEQPSLEKLHIATSEHDRFKQTTEKHINALMIMHEQNPDPQILRLNGVFVSQASLDLITAKEMFKQSKTVQDAVELKTRQAEAQENMKRAHVEAFARAAAERSVNTQRPATPNSARSARKASHVSVFGGGGGGMTPRSARLPSISPRRGTPVLRPHTPNYSSQGVIRDSSRPSFTHEHHRSYSVIAPHHMPAPLSLPPQAKRQTMPTHIQQRRPSTLTIDSIAAHVKLKAETEAEVGVTKKEEDSSSGSGSESYWDSQSSSSSSSSSSSNYSRRPNDVNKLSGGMKPPRLLQLQRGTSLARGVSEESEPEEEEKQVVIGEEEVIVDYSSSDRSSDFGSSDQDIEIDDDIVGEPPSLMSRRRPFALSPQTPNTPGTPAAINVGSNPVMEFASLEDIRFDSFVGEDRIEKEEQEASLLAQKVDVLKRSVMSPATPRELLSTSSRGSSNKSKKKLGLGKSQSSVSIARQGSKALGSKASSEASSSGDDTPDIATAPTALTIEETMEDKMGKKKEKEKKQKKRRRKKKPVTRLVKRSSIISPLAISVEEAPPLTIPATPTMDTMPRTPQTPMNPNASLIFTHDGSAAGGSSSQMNTPRNPGTRDSPSVARQSVGTVVFQQQLKALGGTSSQANTPRNHTNNRTPSSGSPAMSSGAGNVMFRTRKTPALSLDPLNVGTSAPSSPDVTHNNPPRGAMRFFRTPESVSSSNRALPPLDSSGGLRKGPYSTISPPQPRGMMMFRSAAAALGQPASPSVNKTVRKALLEPATPTTPTTPKHLGAARAMSDAGRSSNSDSSNDDDDEDDRSVASVSNLRRNRNLRNFDEDGPDGLTAQDDQLFKGDEVVNAVFSRKHRVATVLSSVDRIRLAKNSTGTIKARDRYKKDIAILRYAFMGTILIAMVLALTGYILATKKMTTYERLAANIFDSQRRQFLTVSCAQSVRSMELASDGWFPIGAGTNAYVSVPYFGASPATSDSILKSEKIRLLALATELEATHNNLASGATSLDSVHASLYSSETIDVGSSDGKKVNLGDAVSFLATKAKLLAETSGSVSASNADAKYVVIQGMQSILRAMNMSSNYYASQADAVNAEEADLQTVFLMMVGIVFPLIGIIFFLPLFRTISTQSSVALNVFLGLPPALVGVFHHNCMKKVQVVSLEMARAQVEAKDLVVQILRSHTTVQKNLKEQDVAQKLFSPSAGSPLSPQAHSFLRSPLSQSRSHSQSRNMNALTLSGIEPTVLTPRVVASPSQEGFMTFGGVQPTQLRNVDNEDDDHDDDSESAIEMAPLNGGAQETKKQTPPPRRRLPRPKVALSFDSEEITHDHALQRNKDLSHTMRAAISWVIILKCFIIGYFALFAYWVVLFEPGANTQRQGHSIASHSTSMALNLAGGRMVTTRQMAMIARDYLVTVSWNTLNPAAAASFNTLNVSRSVVQTLTNTLVLQDAALAYGHPEWGMNPYLSVYNGFRDIYLQNACDTPDATDSVLGMSGAQISAYNKQCTNFTYGVLSQGLSPVLAHYEKDVLRQTYAFPTPAMNASSDSSNTIPGLADKYLSSEVFQATELTDRYYAARANEQMMRDIYAHITEGVSRVRTGRTLFFVFITITLPFFYHLIARFKVQELEDEIDRSYAMLHVIQMEIDKGE